MQVPVGSWYKTCHVRVGLLENLEYMYIYLCACVLSILHTFICITMLILTSQLRVHVHTCLQSKEKQS